MRHVETCCCGASLELVYDVPRDHYNQRNGERDEAQKALATFRRRHKDCAATTTPITEKVA